MRVQRCPGFSITWNLLAHVHATETTSWLKMMMTQFEAKLLDRVERGHPSEIKFLNRTVRWHEDELCFSWSGGARYVEELAKLHGDTGDRSVTKTRTPGTEATGSGARDAPEPLDTFQAAGYRTAASFWTGPPCQFAAKAVMSVTREPRKLEWMRFKRLAKFLVSHDELEWLFPVQDVPEKYVVYRDSDW